MSKFIVITKTLGMLEKRPEALKHVHEHFPIEIQEFDTLEEAAKTGRPVLPLEYYLGYKAAMDVVHGSLKPLKKPFWKFWA